MVHTFLAGRTTDDIRGISHSPHTRVSFCWCLSAIPLVFGFEMSSQSCCFRSGCAMLFQVEMYSQECSGFSLVPGSVCHESVVDCLPILGRMWARRTKWIVAWATYEVFR